MEGAVEYAPAADYLAGLGAYTAVVSPTGWKSLADAVPPPTRLVVPDSLEEIALDRLVAAETNAAGESNDTVVVVGIGGGRALDVAKYLALSTGKELVLVPTALSSLAPFTHEAARRRRRQLHWAGEIAGRTILDLPLLARAAPERNRAGAAEIVSTATAVWDWHLADARDKGLPFVAEVAAVATRCRAVLGEMASEVAACSPEGLTVLADLLGALGAACNRSGHRRLVDGCEHTFVAAFEHRLAQLPSYGGLLGMATVAMATLQAWYGVSAGGPIDPDAVIDLLTRCQVTANPHQLGVDEGTFRGLLRHAVRFHVGEFLPWGVLNEADVNWSASEEMWRMCWRVPATG